MENRVYGLVGRSLPHSFSPRIHGELGNADYRLFELEESELGGFLRRGDIGGLNVTIPYKRAVMSYCSSLSPEAEETGSVNTLVRRGGELIGYNTDIAGFEYMAARRGITMANKKVVIFGTGGAHLAVRTAARKAGAAEIVAISRSGENNYENLHRHYDADILVNATPLGMYPHNGAMPADPTLFRSCAGVLDLVYNPRRTAFLLRAEELGIPCSDGLPMLVAQARAAAELFFDDEIPSSENERILRLIGAETANMILIGMPGCGKTSVGRELARMTGRECIDVDGEIERAEGKSVAEIFAASGEEAFRELEREFTARAGRESGKIIMTGGGVVLDRRNYASLHQNGRIYHLLRATDKLERNGRPLSESGDLSKMQSQRAPLYEAFRDSAINNNGSLKETAGEIWREHLENSYN